MKKLIKKIIIFTIIINIIIQIISIKKVEAIEASDLAEVTLTTSGGITQGETVTITIGVNGTTKGVAGLQGTLEYDKDILEYVEKTMLYDGWRCTGYNNDTGIFLAEISNTSDKNSYITTSTPVISFTFKIKENAKIGVTEFGVSNLVTVNSSLQSRKVTTNIIVSSESDKNTYIDIVNPITYIKDFIKLIQTNNKIEIFDNEMNKITDTNKKIATGMIVQISNNKEIINTYEVTVKGDLLGSGDMDAADLLKLARYKAGLDTNLSGAYLKAADLNGNGTYADDADLLKMARIIAELDSF